ncbi:MAG TPA: toll/interleukin-1 receptor domain-containing protein [Chitinophagaceae bacterium]|nr:toll/interleukin-1 receptor domain-containing protein [Chitinophagaceae bacterium]
MSDIVISYSREDKKSARLLANKLMASGWSVWWDRDLLGGQDYDMAIETELQMARCVIVIWSALSVKSHFVKDEANAALARNILVPVSFDDTEPPLGFRMTHILKFEDSNNISEEEYNRLYQSIVKKAGEPGNPIYVPPPAKKSSKVGWLLLGLAAAILIIYFIVSGMNKGNGGRTGDSGKIVDTPATVIGPVINQPEKNDPQPPNELPTTVSFLKGTWQLVWAGQASESVVITEDGKYYSNGIHSFNITDFEYNKTNHRITFVKRSILDTRILSNTLSVENENSLIGTEADYSVKYTRLSK